MSFIKKKNAPDLDEKKKIKMHRDMARSERLMEQTSSCVKLIVGSYKHTSSELTQLFDLEPYDTMDKGDTIYEDSRYLMKNNRGYWVFNSAGKLESNLLEKHIEWMLSKLYDKRDLLLKLQQQGATTRLHFNSESKSVVAGFAFKSEVIKRIAQLNLELDCTFVFDS